MRTVSDAGPAERPGPRWWMAALAWAFVIAGLTTYLAIPRDNLTSRIALGNLAITAGLIFGAIACGRAAVRSREARAGWAWMALALALGTVGQVVFTVSAVLGDTAQSSPVTVALGYLGYAVPSVVALLLFPAPPVRLISRFRGVLDAVVITTGVALISEATVLRAVRASADLSTLAGRAQLAYPVADVAIGSVVLTLGMRQAPRVRPIWFCLGTGLLSLAVTDSVYVRLLAEGSTGLTGSPLVAGWVVSPVLIGLAAAVPESPGGYHWNFDLATQLVPYVPVLGAVIVVAVSSARQDPFLLATGVLLLVTVTVRQVIIVYENLSLTRDLESKVAARTAELATLGSIVTSSRDAIAAASTAGVITAWNPAAERLFGLPAAEVLGRSLDFLTPDDAARVRFALVAAQRGEVLPAHETEWVRRDGTTVPVAMTVSPVLAGGVVQGVSIAGRDVTTRREEARVLERAREEALEASRLKSEFLATMSHEIRTPMNGVIGLTSLLLDTDLDDRQRGYAEGVRSAGQSLLQVINDILDFSKLEAGKVVLEVHHIDLRRLVHDVGTLLAPAAFAKGLELLVDYPPDAPSVVRGDPVRIRQILLNLTANAVKFTAEGEVAIRVTAAAAGSGRTTFRFAVSDTGIGVAEADQGRLFDSFSQADASTTRRYGGTGLGLAICRRLVEAMGGEIGLNSTVGHGATFWFSLELPLADEVAPVVKVRPQLTAGLRVLVVDDNATNRTILTAQLTAWRLEVDAVENAPEALERLRHAARTAQQYDLAILDLLMPETDGLQLAHAVAADSALAGLTMIMLTSAQPLEPGAFADAGIGRWLSKPVSAPDLYAQIVALLGPAGGGEAERPAAAETRSPPFRGRLLVVEDNELNQLVAVGLAARIGFQTTLASDGAQALDALAGDRFSAVLMDCHMPVMDGFAATRELRRREGAARHTPVIALTAGALASDRERCLAAGMDDYLAKPIDADQLGAALERWASNGSRPAVGRSARDGAERPAPTAAPVIDAERLESLNELQTPDGASLLASFVASFTRRSPQRIAALRRAAEGGDDDAIAQVAHQLKGAAGTIGAVQVAALCAELEDQVEAVGRDRPQILSELERELDRATRALSAFVAGSW